MRNSWCIESAAAAGESRIVPAAQAGGELAKAGLAGPGSAGFSGRLGACGAGSMQRAAMTCGLSSWRLAARVLQVRPRTSRPGLSAWLSWACERAKGCDAAWLGPWKLGPCETVADHPTARFRGAAGQSADGAVARAVLAPGQRRPLRARGPVRTASPSRPRTTGARCARGGPAPPVSAGPACGMPHRGATGRPWSPPAVGLSGGRQQRSAPCRSPLSTSRPPSSSSRWMR